MLCCILFTAYITTDGLYILRPNFRCSFHFLPFFNYATYSFCNEEANGLIHISVSVLLMYFLIQEIQTDRQTDRQVDRQRQRESRRKRESESVMINSLRSLPLMKGCRWMTYYLTVHTIIIPMSKKTDN